MKLSHSACLKLELGNRTRQGAQELPGIESLGLKPGNTVTKKEEDKLESPKRPKRREEKKGKAR